MSTAPLPPSYDQITKPNIQPTPPPGSYPQQQYLSQPASYPIQVQQAAVDINVVHGQAPPGFMPSRFGEVPIQTTCSACGSGITTDTTYKAGGLTWLIFGLLWIFWFFGCCIFSWVPFCVKSCKDVEHSCPNCKAILGRYRRLQ